MACPPRKGSCAESCFAPPAAQDAPPYDALSDTKPKPTKVIMDTNYRAKRTLVYLSWTFALSVSWLVAYLFGVHVERVRSAETAALAAAQPTPSDPVIVLIDEVSGECLTMLHKTRTFACSQEVPGLLTYQPVPARER